MKTDFDLRLEYWKAQPGINARQAKLLAKQPSLTMAEQKYLLVQRARELWAQIKDAFKRGFGRGLKKR
jgi:hypothetical protein